MLLLKSEKNIFVKEFLPVFLFNNMNHHKREKYPQDSDIEWEF